MLWSAFYGCNKPRIKSKQGIILKTSSSSSSLASVDIDGDDEEWIMKCER